MQIKLLTPREFYKHIPIHLHNGSVEQKDKLSSFVEIKERKTEKIIYPVTAGTSRSF